MLVAPWTAWQTRSSQIVSFGQSLSDSHALGAAADAGAAAGAGVAAGAAGLGSSAATRNGLSDLPAPCAKGSSVVPAAARPDTPATRPATSSREARLGRITLRRRR